MALNNFEVDLTSDTSCLLFIQAELEPFGLQAPRDTRLKLSLEAGKQGETTVHRPYIRLAAILERAVNTTHVNEGKGAASAAVFRDADKTITGWRSEQAQIDAALGLTLPAAPSTGVPSKGSYTVRTLTSWE